MKHEEVVRGQELAAPDFLIPSRTLTLRLHALPSHPRPIKHRAPVRFHAGTAEILGTLSLLDADQLNPGQWGLAQVFLEEPTTTIWGQPFVVRGPSATYTLGGGLVLQPAATKIRRRHTELLERVQKLAAGGAAERARQVAWFRAYAGVTAADLVRGAALAPTEAERCLAELREQGLLLPLGVGPRRSLLIDADLLAELNERIVAVLARWHEQFPLMSSHDRQKLEAQLNYLQEAALVHAAVDKLLAAKRLVGGEKRVALAEHKPKLSAALRKLKDKMVEAYKAAAFQPPEPKEFAPHAGGNAGGLRDLYEVCVAEGDLAALGGDLYLHAEHEAELRRRVRAKLDEGKGLTVAEIRDLLGTTRKYAVPLCEYLDRIGVTRREGDLRFAGPPLAASA